MKTTTLKSKYAKSEEVKAKEARFAKRVKLTFIIVPIIFITAYVIWNVILGNPMHP